MIERIQKFLDRIESRIALWKIASTSGILSIGGVSAWIASVTDWLDQYGAVAWWFAGLCGALITTLIVLAFARIRYEWDKASATRKWKEQTDGVNPLEPEFHKLRIGIQEFVNPMNPRISNKKFYDCELIGPANLYLHANNTFLNSLFLNCDIIALDPNRANRKVIVNNAIALEDSELHGCQIMRCTLLLDANLVPAFQKMGAKFLTIIEGPNKVVSE